MTTLPNIFTIKQKLAPQAGRVLISEPLMNDGIFGRSVVLLAEYNKQGSVGYILNKYSGFTIQQLLPIFKGFTLPVFIGGPVATNTLHFIYQSNKKLTNTIQIGENLYWGGNINELYEWMKSNKLNESEVRFFVGYSGWERNQLNEELDQGYWIISHFYKELFFEESDITNFWKRNVILLDSKFHFWLNIPTDPALN